MYIRIEKLQSQPAKTTESFAADADNVAIDVSNEETEETTSIEIEVSRDGDLETRVLVDGECVWSGLGFE